MLPVERLYGQRPLVIVGNPRCQPCSLCTPLGCIDLAPGKSIPQVIGPARRSHAWTVPAFGAFAAAFPGFVIGYYTTTDGPLASAGHVYAHVGMWMLGSYVVVALGVLLLDLSAEHTIGFLAALAAALYYWFAAPLVAAALGVPGAGATVLRVAAFGLVGFWLWRGALRSRRRPAPTQPR